MLQAIRSRAGSFVVKVLFALLILTFGIWGIGDIFRTRGTDTVVATVGDQSIRAEELQTALRRALEQLSARFGSAIDLQQAKQLGLVDQTLAQLIDRSLIDQEAARLQARCFGRSDPQCDHRQPELQGIRRAFRSRPVQRGARRQQPHRGPVCRAAAPRYSAQRPAARGDGRERQRRNRWSICSTGTATRSAPPTSSRCRSPASGDVGQPSEDELKAFYEEHQDLFRAPEYRGFTLVSLNPSDIAKDIEIPEAKLKEEYDQRQDELQIPERRDVEQILAPSEEKAKEAEAALAAGKDWREVATTIAGQDPDTIDLGLMRREEMPSALAEVAFELPLNKPSEPVKTPLGWHILRVVKIEPPVTQTFDQAKPKLEADLDASGSGRSDLQGREQGR